MKYLKILSLLLLFVIPLKSLSQGTYFGSVTKFEVLPQFLTTDGKIKVVSGTSKTTIQFKASFARQTLSHSPLVYKPFDMTVFLSTYDGSLHTLSISGGFRFTSSDFPNEEASMLEVVLTADIINSKLYTGHNIILAFQSPDFLPEGSFQGYNGKDYGYQLVPPPNGNLETSVPPVSGSVPLYDFTFADGSHNYLTSPPAVYSSGSILGYLFTSQQTGTVPLHKYTQTTNGNIYLTLNQQAYAGYTYTGIAGYVYASQVAKSQPIYEHFVQAPTSRHIYRNQIGIIAGNYIYSGAVFYMLQSNQVTTHPVPSEGLLELYEYYSSTYQDHYYTTKKQSYDTYTYEKVLGYIQQTQVAGTVPIYLYYDNTHKDHFYTVTQQNYPGLIYEGIVGYGFTGINPSSPFPVTPIYRYFSSAKTDHYYNPTSAFFAGYNAEGVEFYLGYYGY